MRIDLVGSHVPSLENSRMGVNPSVPLLASTVWRIILSTLGIPPIPSPVGCLRPNALRLVSGSPTPPKVLHDVLPESLAPTGLLLVGLVDILSLRMDRPYSTNIDLLFTRTFRTCPLLGRSAFPHPLPCVPIRPTVPIRECLATLFLSNRGVPVNLLYHRRACPHSRRDSDHRVKIPLHQPCVRVPSQRAPRFRESEASC